jgi:adenine-specific DNA-methyltransferase
MKNISFFNNPNLFEAGSRFFNELSIPLNTIEEKAFAKEDILQHTYNAKSEAHQLIDQIFLLGLTDNQSFTGERNFEDLNAIQNLTADYQGLLVIAVELKLRENKLSPTRSQLAEISRAFNREFMYTPVTILYRYGEYIALANSERSAYKAKYREGEKVGKVSLLRDIRFNEPHTGHLQILQGLVVPDKITTFKDLYKHWTDVFSVNVLNKKFYQELSNWYFWAIKNVTFPGEPSLEEAIIQGKDYKELLQEQKATNVIRMLTRLLFVWFMKEKKLIPEELFDLERIKSDILNQITPYQEVGMFTEHNKESVYYKAILQNLFFATLNCPIKADSADKRERGFRLDGTNRGIDYLMRYKKYFKNSEAFLARVNEVVPFLNGGLFECLDDKDNNVYVDGFTDNKKGGDQLIVPDYLFFGLEEETDLSEIIGIADKKNKIAAVKGLINILKSYKFTITENTPIEEEVALDPELLGKVFENLLASYNPETKTTARKQTGSFYTPREIVNYMVDESLIAYLKNKIQSADTVLTELGQSQAKLFGDEGKVGQTRLMGQHSGSELKNDEKLLDNLLHNLVSYNPENPFARYPKTSKIILEHLDTCTILDPACGSGAFPMGILQKMVHILHKLDPDNRIWKEVQIDKAKKESDEAFDIADKKVRENRLIEINEAFDLDTNNPDYARKLFLIENCIYGVDIQPIATQISKLRFFISLVVEQNVDENNDNNFGIRPLPNLETKFVAANTLIGIEKKNTLFSTNEIKELEKNLKNIGTWIKIFVYKSPAS